MISALGLFSGLLLRLFRSRRDILLENLALRQQLVVLKRRRRRPRLGAFDKLFWVIARKLWSRWQQALIVVMPDTVVRWHRAGFQLYWRLISKARKAIGRKPTPKQVRELIFRMVRENPTWGAPRIHGELRVTPSIRPRRIIQVQSRHKNASRFLCFDYGPCRHLLAAHENPTMLGLDRRVRPRLATPIHLPIRGGWNCDESQGWERVTIRVCQVIGAVVIVLLIFGIFGRGR